MRAQGVVAQNNLAGSADFGRGSAWPLIPSVALTNKAPRLIGRGALLVRATAGPLMVDPVLVPVRAVAAALFLNQHAQALHLLATLQAHDVQARAQLGGIYGYFARLSG